MTHDELRDLIPGYTLDALERADARAVEAHLPGCEACRREVSALRGVAAELALAVAPVDPPGWLRGAVLGIARPASPFRLLSRSWQIGLAAAAALILLLGVATVAEFARVRALTASVGALSGRLAAQERVLALVASPTARTAVLRGTTPGNVRFVYDPGNGEGALVVSELRDPGTAHVYQLWLVAGQEPQSAGVFRPIPGQPIVLPVTGDFRRYQAVAISIEQGPRGSAAGPTSAPVLTAVI